MNRYLLSVCYPAGSRQPAPEQLQKIMRDVMALQTEMKNAGVWVFSGGLQPPDSARVLRHQQGELVRTDGPFVETKEQIGGITVLQESSLEAALGWGARLAQATTTPVEVRPFFAEMACDERVSN